jgi:hypothetical protein
MEIKIALRKSNSIKYSSWEIKFARLCCRRLLEQMTAPLRYYFIIIISASAENVRAQPGFAFSYSRFLTARRAHAVYSSLGSLLFTTLINKALAVGMVRE